MSGTTRLSEAEGRERLVSAAVDLALEVGGPGFTVRQVAARAGLNHGLVHRYFGTKNALLAEVIDRMVAEATSAQQPLSVVRDHRCHVLTLLLAHISANPDSDCPVLDISPMLELLSRRTDLSLGDELKDPRARSAVRLATILGWVCNENLIVSACQLGDSLRVEVEAAIDVRIDPESVGSDSREDLGLEQAQG